jgi:methyl-accepting chemotaxis protein-1 (serine sensor receptor)
LHNHPITLHTDRVRENIETIAKAWAAYRATQLTEEEKKLAAEYEERQEKFIQQGLNPVIDQYEQGQFKSANIHMVKVVNPAFNQSRETAQALLQLQMDVAREAYEDAVADYHFSRNLAVFVILAGIALAAVAGFFLIRAIVNPLNQAVNHFHHIADGDLSQQVVVASDNETGRVLAGLKDMQDKIRSLISQVKEAVAAIDNAAREIAAGNTNLSQRTEEQAASLEETAASMEEMTSTVQQNAGNAHQANQLAQGASEVAVRGGHKVNEVVEIMESITESSRQIADITNVIDSIAFQTNILALNAAVEAARAGEQGRGFVVVADEVRTLAQKSAAAAKEIKTLIERSVGTVEAGSERVREAGATMDELVSSVKRVTAIIAEIAGATDEQSRGIEQINTTVSQMDQMTQQNAALVEEAAAAAKSLEEQAAQLTETVGVFRLDAATVH